MPGENWKPGYDVSLTFPGAVSPHVTDWEFTQETRTFEVSNIVTQAYEEGVGLTIFRVRGTLVIDEDDVRVPAHNTYGDCSFNDGLVAYSGKFRVTTTTKSGDMQGAFQVRVEGTFTGTVTVA